MLNLRAFTEEQKRRFVMRYDNCRTVEEKRSLARELGMPVERLYNICSRWARYRAAD